MSNGLEEKEEAPSKDTVRHKIARFSFSNKM
jgi:hypothetical protein